LLLALNGEDGDGRLLVGRYFDNLFKSKRALRAGQWYHVALSFDGRRVRLWIGGEPDTELEAPLDLPPSDLAIGRLIDRTLRTPADYRCRPHVWHEFNNTYIAPLPDLEIEKRLTGAQTQAWVLEPHRQRLASGGLLSRYPDLRRLSIEWYREYVKQAFERARRMPRLDGYAWWVVSDIPGGVETDVTSYGILDMLYRPEKFPDPAWFLQFNGESALLCDAETDQRVLRCGETRNVAFQLAHFGAEPVNRGRLAWSALASDRLLQQGCIENLHAAPGGPSALGSIMLGPWDLAGPAKVEVRVALESSACRVTNNWKFWAFPAKKAGAPLGRIVNRTGDPLLDARYGAPNVADRTSPSVVLATELSEALLADLRAGARVVLLDQDKERSAVSRPAVVHENGRPEPRSTVLRRPGVLTYWPYWLRCGAQVVERHPALGNFPHDGFCDFQLMRLYGSATATVDYTPRGSLARTKVRPIVWGLSLIPWSEDASKFNLALAWGGLVSECRVEQGRLLVCNLYVLDGIRRGYPEAGYLLDCLAAYALGDRFDPPQPGLSAEQAERWFRVEGDACR
jgi:hypothetical protein